MHSWYRTTDFGAATDPMPCAPGESPQAEQTNEEPAPKPQEQRKERKKPVEDGLDIENGEMNGNAIWEQRGVDKAGLVLEGGYARLSDYDTGGTTSARRSG